MMKADRQQRKTFFFAHRSYVMNLVGLMRLTSQQARFAALP